MTTAVRAFALLGLSVAALGGCDNTSADEVAVAGHVVDAATGRPPDPGPALIEVTGAQFLGPTVVVLRGEAGADGRFRLSGGAGPYGEFNVTVSSDGEVAYPISGAPSPYDGYLRLAYFPVDLPYERDVGTVELHPTCLTVGSVRLSRPLAPSELLRVRTASAPELPVTAVAVATEHTYHGSPAEGDVPPDSLRLLGVGGRPARLEWEIEEYNPPTGRGGDPFARGSVPLGACARHGVLRYSVTIGLPR